MIIYNVFWFPYYIMCIYIFLIFFVANKESKIEHTRVQTSLPSVPSKSKHMVYVFFLVVGESVRSSESVWVGLLQIYSKNWHADEVKIQSRRFAVLVTCSKLSTFLVAFVCVDQVILSLARGCNVSHSTVHIFLAEGCAKKKRPYWWDWHGQLAYGYACICMPQVRVARAIRLSSFKDVSKGRFAIY